MAYWLRYETPIERTIINKRAADWAGLYHHCLSAAGLGEILNINCMVSRFVMRMRLSSNTLYFNAYFLPSLVRAMTLIFFDFLP